MPRVFAFVAMLAACGGGDVGQTPVHELDTEAKNGDGLYISWREHLIDDETSSGVDLRGAAALAVGDLNQDGFVDVVSAFQDARFIRVAFGGQSADDWFRLSLAEGEEAQGVADVAIGDVNGDGWADMVAAVGGGLLYLENPAEEAPGFRWGRSIPDATADGGPWRRVSLADLDGDGRLDVLAAGADSIVWFTAGADALDPAGWKANDIGPLAEAVDAQAVDLDADGDLDVFSASASELVWFEHSENGFEQRAIDVEGGELSPAGPVAIDDLNGDGRPDVALAAGSDFVWLEQPGEAGSPWARYAIGSIAPDEAAGLTLADVDGDGDLDLLGGSESNGPEEEDGEDLGVDGALGRIAWFQNPGGVGEWGRHDIVRRLRGAFAAFIARDMDDDGDLDFMGVRGASGEFDGVFWLQQLHSDVPLVRFQPAREEESQAMPLP